MNNKTLDAISFGSCYVDTNASEYPFAATGIPVETELVGGAYQVVPGGSAVNFCMLLQALGLNTSFVGMIGDDPNGEVLEELLQEQGVKPALVRRPELLTNISFGMTNPDGEHIMLVAGTANAALSPEVVLPQLEATLPSVALLFMGGCFKLKAFWPAYKDIAAMARKDNTHIVVDHNRIPAGTVAATLQIVRELVLEATYYLPSRQEFCQLWEVETIEEGVRLLYEKAPELTVVVKDGGNGAYYGQKGVAQHVPGLKVQKVLNLTGAGDFFNAGVMRAIVQERPLSEAVSYGCQVAAAKIQGKEAPRL